MLISQVSWLLVAMPPPQAAATTNSEHWVGTHENKKTLLHCHRPLGVPGKEGRRRTNKRGFICN